MEATWFFFNTIFLYSFLCWLRLRLSGLQSDRSVHENRCNYSGRRFTENILRMTCLKPIECQLSFAFFFWNNLVGYWNRRVYSPMCIPYIGHLASVSTIWCNKMLTISILACKLSTTICCFESPVNKCDWLRAQTIPLLIKCRIK